MISYSKTYWGLPLLFRLYGSALPRAVPPSLLSALITGLLVLVGRHRVDQWWLHPYTYSIFSFIVGFVLVFRANFAYQRYSTAADDVAIMSSRWRMAVLEFLIFDHPGTRQDLDSGQVFGNTNKDVQSRKHHGADQDGPRQHFATALVHLASLLHALALQVLRGDHQLQNVWAHDSGEQRPPSDPANLEQTDGGRVGRFSALSDVFMLRTSKRHRQRYDALTPLAVIGGLSEHERQLLSRPGPEGKSKKLASLRPYVVMAWLQQLLHQRQRHGGLPVPPPILAQAYQQLAEGMVAFDRANKVGDIPLPFPMAQVVLTMLLLHTVIAPMLILAYVKALWLAIVVTFISVYSYWAVNEVARDIEDPFLYEPNNLPLQKQQYDFNEQLLAICIAQQCQDFKLATTSAEAGAVLANGSRAAAVVSSASVQQIALQLGEAPTTTIIT